MRLMPFNSATIDQFTLTLLGSRIARCSCLAACLPPSVGGSMHGASRPNFGSWARRTSDEALPLQLSARIGRVPAGQALPERIV